MQKIQTYCAEYEYMNIMQRPPQLSSLLPPWPLINSKARFPLGEFVRATRSENKNPAT